MAAILKLRRGSTTPTTLEESELFYNSSLGTLQVGKTSANNDNITLVKLTDVNTGNLRIVGTLSGSALTLSGDITASNILLSGDLNARDVRLSGNIYLGNEISDNINVTAQVSGSLIPSASNEYDLGSDTRKWKNLYAVSASIDNISVPGSGILSSSATTFLNFSESVDSHFDSLDNFSSSINSTIKQKLNVENVISGSSQVTISSTTGFTTFSSSISDNDVELFSTASDHEGRIDVLELNSTELFATASDHETRIDFIENYSESIDSRLDYLEGDFSSSIDLELIELFATASNHEDRIVYLSGSFSSSVDSRLDELEINSGSVSQSISLLNQFTSSQDTKNSTLATYTASVDSDITELYTTASDHETRIDGIQDYTSSLRTAIGLNGTNVTINGDLSVLGTTTQINSTQVNIGDNILELNYGGAVYKGGIFVSDATGTLTSGSLLWNSVTDRWIAGASGSESTILLAGGDNVVSSSAQVVDALKSTFLEIEGDNVVSGSSQIDLTQTTNYISGIKDRLNSETVISGSSQVILSESVDYVSAIKHRLNIESVISSSIQVDVYNTTNFTTYSASIDDKIIQLISDSASQDVRLDNLEAFSASEESKNSTIASYTGSNDDKWDVLGNVTQSLINATSSYETTGRGIVSGSSQLTASYDLKYAQSESFHKLVGAWDFDLQGSIRDAAFYSVTSSAQLDTNNPNFTSSLNDSIIFTAGAVKEYVNFRTEAILDAIATADITAVIAENGLSGGGASGDVTLGLDTGSAHFTNGIKNKLNTEGVISGSSQIVSILGPLNTFSSSQESKDSTLATYTGSVNSQLTELYTTSSNHETRIDNLESWSSSLDTLFVTENELTTLSSSIDSRLDNSEAFSSSINTTIKTKLNVEGVLSGSSQIVSILGPLNTFSASQESKDSTLAIYTGSIDTKFSTLGTYTGSVDNSITLLNAVSHSHSNKANLDTINQNLAITSDVTFGSLHTTGTGSIGTNLTIYGDLTVFGTQSIINSTNLAVSDNMIYLNNGSEITNPDLGIVGNYNDGIYAHSGIFSDASDSQTWKVFKGYTLEPSGSIDTSHVSFALADFKAANITATSFNGTINANNGVISGSSQLIATLPSGVVSGSSQITYTNISSIPAGIVSGSSQITLSSTTGGSITSNVQFGSLGIGMAASGTSGRIDATNDIVAYSSSDKRFKENITPIQNALSKINQIGGYEFDWNEETKLDHGYEGHDIGVIAQEIEKIAPELVQTRENGYKAVKYDKLVSILIEGIKELSEKVSQLEKK